MGLNMKKPVWGLQTTKVQTSLPIPAVHVIDQML